MKLLKAVITLAVALFAANEQTAQAATAPPTSFLVSATVASACIVAATPLAFGVYDPSAADNDKTSTITVTCTLGTLYDIGLDKGANGSSVIDRQMTGSPTADLLAYSLFRDSSRTLNWGNTVGTDTVNVASASGLPVGHTVYGRITAGHNVTAGAYTDTINVTVTY